MIENALIVRACIEIDKQATFAGKYPVCPDERVVYRQMLLMYLFSSPSSLAVASCLKQKGLAVRHLDLAGKYGIPLTREKNEERYAAVARDLEENGYDLIGISCTAGVEYNNTLRIADIAKKVNPQCTLMVGGYHGASVAEDIVRSGNVDIVVVSDFEPIADQLLKALNGAKSQLADVPNIVYRDGDAIRSTERKSVPFDLDTVSTDFSLDADSLNRYATHFFECSRGCPYNCTFCQEKVLRRRYLKKSPEKAVDDIARGVEYISAVAYRPVFGYFSDPLWGLEKKWLHEFCERLIEKQKTFSHRFHWACLGRVGGYTSKDLERMRDAGCVLIFCGVESFSPKMLRVMNKTREPDKYLSLIDTSFSEMLNQGISAEANMIICCPGETKESLLETEKGMSELCRRLSHIQGADLNFEVNLFSPLPGTPLHNDLKDGTKYREYGTRIVIEKWWEKGVHPHVCCTVQPSSEIEPADAVEALARISNIEDHELWVWENSVRPVGDLSEKEIITPEDLMIISLGYG
jgi:radical SAM superfamily enzyme YgiQ (UPF0313 family)